MIESFKGEYRFLSNFWPCEIEWEGIKYPSTENAYQAAKTLDLSDRQKIASMKPGEAKKFGRKVRMREDWDEIKLKVMEDINRIKFTSSRELEKKLVLTNGQELIEGNNWNDTFWGVCKGKGQNNLGKILMKIRNDLLWEGSVCASCGKNEVKDGKMGEHDERCVHKN